jgi:hypothetical protein
MLSATQLDQAAERLVKAATRPVTVIVLGFYARGDASEAFVLDMLAAQASQPIAT